MSEFAVVSFGRKQSERCPNKMLKPFGGTTLTDVMLSKLMRISVPSYFAGYEHEFKAKSEQYQVNFIQRSQTSVSIDEPITDILSFLHDIPQQKILLVNACLPFLRLKTIQAFLDGAMKNSYDSAFAVVKRNNFYFDMNKTPLNFHKDLKTINTKKADPVYEFAHALYLFDKDYFFRHGRYWDWSAVKLIEMGAHEELIDIDTEDDFTFAEMIFLSKYVKKGARE